MDAVVGTWDEQHGNNFHLPDGYGPEMRYQIVGVPTREGRALFDELVCDRRDVFLRHLVKKLDGFPIYRRVRVGQLARRAPVLDRRGVLVCPCFQSARFPVRAGIHV